MKGNDRVARRHSTANKTKQTMRPELTKQPGAIWWDLGELCVHWDITVHTRAAGEVDFYIHCRGPSPNLTTTATTITITPISTTTWLSS